MKNKLPKFIGMSCILMLHGCSTAPDAPVSLNPLINTPIEFESSYGLHKFSVVEITSVNPKFNSGRSDNIKDVTGRITVSGHPYDITPSFNAVASIKTDNNPGSVADVSKIHLTGVTKLHTNGIEDTLKMLIALTLLDSKITNTEKHDH